MEEEIRAHRGVCCLYDLHLWSISSGRDALSAHVVVPDNFGPLKTLLQDIAQGLKSRFGIDHVTLQIEESHEMRDSGGAAGSTPPAPSAGMSRTPLACAVGEDKPEAP